VLGDLIQPTHLLLVLVVALLVLGPKRLPEVGRGLGNGIRDFRKGLAGLEEHISGPTEDQTVVHAAPASQSHDVATEAPPAIAYVTASSEPQPSGYAD
jgi:sec-independent protein translocase protein TatA